MKYTKEEVVELFNEFDKELPNTSKYKFITNNFLKEKGLIKEEFEVGKWYKSKNHNITACYVDEHNNYGVSFGVWKDAMILNYFEAWTLATDKEVETALIKEAKKRGFKEGVKYNCNNVMGRKDEVLCGKVIFDYDYNGLFCSSNGWIFEDGKWATIIEEPKEMTMAEVNKALGYEIKIKE
tara:strand:+ start:2091 stop:2633 length:543 start_codon:yes stop_codon:yes gene_type:complete